MVWVWASHLNGIVCIYEQVSATDATVDTAQGHEEAEGEEVTVVKVAHTVIQPGWDADIKENHHLFIVTLCDFWFYKTNIWNNVSTKDTTMMVHFQNAPANKIKH